MVTRTLVNEFARCANDLDGFCDRLATYYTLWCAEGALGNVHDFFEYALMQARDDKQTLRECGISFEQAQLGNVHILEG